MQGTLFLYNKSAVIVLAGTRYISYACALKGTVLCYLFDLNTMHAFALNDNFNVYIYFSYTNTNYFTRHRYYFYRKPVNTVQATFLFIGFCITSPLTVIVLAGTIYIMCSLDLHFVINLTWML